MKFDSPEELGLEDLYCNSEEVLAAPAAPTHTPSASLPDPERLREKGRESAKIAEMRHQFAVERQELTLEILERIGRGDTFVECVAWLVKDHKVPVQMAQEIMDLAINETIGKVDHASWTAQYRMLGQDLYKQALKKNKTAMANSVLNTLVKLQYLSQSWEMRQRVQDHQEEKFKTIVNMPGMKLEATQSPQALEAGEKEKGTTQTQGFRLQIESYPTQSIPSKEVIEVKSVPKTES